MTDSGYREGVINFLEPVEAEELYHTIQDAVKSAGYVPLGESKDYEKTVTDRRTGEKGSVSMFAGMIDIFFQQRDTQLMRMRVSTEDQDEDGNLSVPFAYNRYGDADPSVVEQVMDDVCERLGITDEEYTVLDVEE